MSETAKRVLLVDDEPAARRHMRNIIAAVDGLQIIAEIGEGRSAVEAIRTQQPDIVFLDIDMPEVDGFEVAAATEALPYHLVFVTAHHEYALKAFNTHAIDYVLKPVRPSVLEKCIAKILHREEVVLEQLSPQLSSQGQESGHLVLTDSGVSRVLAYDHILCIEGVGRYRRIHLSAEGTGIHGLSTLLSDITLDEFMIQLDAGSFLRVHRSYIVNRSKAVALKTRERRHYLTVEELSEAVPVSRSQVKALKEAFHR